MNTIAASGIQCEDDYLTTLLNLNEMVMNRHGVMIIGEPLAGKS